MSTNETSMERFRVYCNKQLIASFPTSQLAGAFASKRKGMFPRNNYHISDATVDGPQGPFADERNYYRESRRFERREREDSSEMERKVA